MNKQSIEHNNLQKQSWNDDPFDLPWPSQGVTTLTFERDLHFYAQELVAHYGQFDGECYNVTFDSLPEFAQNELSAKYFEYTDRETSACVHGNDYALDNDFTCAILAMLKDDNKKTREAFAEVTRNNIIKHYEKDLQKVLDDACHDYLHSINNEQGLFAGTCRDSGDLVWSKR